MAGGRFSIEAIFSAKDRFSPMLGQIQGKVSRFRTSMSSSFNDVDRMIDRAFGGLKTMGVAGAAATAGLGAGLYSVVQTGADLEHTLVAAAAKFSPAFRRGTQEFKQLQLAAEGIGGSTEFGAQAAASALKDLGAAGLNVQQALAVLPGVVDLGTASEIGLSEASTFATKSLGAFNLMTEDTTKLTANFNRVLDSMARTADMTTADMGGLFESIREGAPVATAAGASVETFLAIAGQLSQAGIDGSVAGTTLKDMFLRLAAPTTEAAGALSVLGIKTADAKGNLRDIVGILGDLEGKTKKMGTAQRADVLEQIFGKIPLAGVTALLSAGTDKIRGMRTELEHAGGSMKRMAGIMRDDTKGELDRFGQALASVRTAIFNVVEVPLTPLLEGTTAWVRANRELVATRLDAFLTRAVPLVKDFGLGFVNGFGNALGPLREVTTWVLRLAGALPGLGTAAESGEKLGELAGMLFTVAIGVKAVTGAMNGISAIANANPWTLFAVGVMAVGAAVVLYGPEIKQFAKDHKVLVGVVAIGAGVFFGFAIAQRAVAAATVLANGARLAYAGITWAASAAETFFIGEVVATSAATDVAAASFVAADLSLTPLIATLGLAAAAMGSLIAVWYEWQGLEQASGGHVWEGVKGVFNGKGFFGAIDEAENEDARKKYAAEHGGAPALGYPAGGEGAPPPPQTTGVVPQLVGGASSMDPALLQSLVEALQKQQNQKLEIDVRTEQGTTADVKDKGAGSKKPIVNTRSGGFRPPRR